MEFPTWRNKSCDTSDLVLHPVLKQMVGASVDERPHTLPPPHPKAQVDILSGDSGRMDKTKSNSQVPKTYELVTCNIEI